jgi:hypothetical protein
MLVLEQKMMQVGIVEGGIVGVDGDAEEWDEGDVLA